MISADSSQRRGARRPSPKGVRRHFVQDNHTLSGPKGTVCGLHFQVPPFAQDKLVRVIEGAIFDVTVELRRGSPTFGEQVAVEVSAEKWNQVLVPAGFAHGFCTVAPNTQLLYKVTRYYAPEHERGLLWSDPALGIDWAVSTDQVLLSERDRTLPRLDELASPFD